MNLHSSAKGSDLDLDGLEVVVPRLGAHEEDFLTRPAGVVGVVGIVLICREENVAGRDAVEVVTVLEVKAHVPWKWGVFAAAIGSPSAVVRGSMTCLVASRSEAGS